MFVTLQLPLGILRFSTLELIRERSTWLAWPEAFFPSRIWNFPGGIGTYLNITDFRKPIYVSCSSDPTTNSENKHTIFHEKIRFKVIKKSIIKTMLEKIFNDKSLEVYVVISQKNLSCTIFNKKNDKNRKIGNPENWQCELCHNSWLM